MEPPSTPKKSCQLPRDQRIQACTLHNAGLTYADIAQRLHCTQRQVQYACQAPRFTPKKGRGRRMILSQSQQEELIEFVTSSKHGRRYSYLQLSCIFNRWGVGEYAIRSALRKAGFKRYMARTKPPLSEKNKRKRFEWAMEHRNWTYAQWASIFWTDETWVTGGRHTRVWVTRRKGEELDPTCIEKKVQRRIGWMFWGGFNDTSKGPCLFWEKEWGSINQITYSERILPLIHGWLRLHPDLRLMQDHAPGHNGASTLEELREWGVDVIDWPPFSPDLNPIETVWNKMKDYIAANFPENMTYDQLRAAVYEAWESITPEFLHDLLDEMKKRCEAVITAQGGHTQY